MSAVDEFLRLGDMGFEDKLQQPQDEPASWRRFLFHPNLLLLLIAVLAVAVGALAWDGYVESQGQADDALAVNRLSEDAFVLAEKALSVHTAYANWSAELLGGEQASDQLSAASQRIDNAQAEFDSAINSLATAAPTLWDQELFGILRREHTAFVQLQQQVQSAAVSGSAVGYASAKQALLRDGPRLTASVTALTQVIGLNFAHTAVRMSLTSAQRMERVQMGLVATSGLSLVLTLALGFLLRRRWLQSQQLISRLHRRSMTDALTQLPNRRAFGQELTREMARAQRSGQPLTLALIDLDRFKEYNDLFGHPRGDALLAQAAIAWKKALRPTDLLARVGGEEFAILMADSSAQNASASLERLRLATPESQTFSAGLAQLAANEPSADLIDRADKALYRAKQTGRNRSVIADKG
jgi:diguanylate cyclase (GGDEF)-like protein